jgi:hypothetical protein
MTPQPGDRDNDQQQIAVKLFKFGAPIDELAVKLGVSEETILGWVEDAAHAEDSDIEDLGLGKKSVFLSHNRVDRPFVRRIFRELRKRGVPCWLDEAEILPGDSLIEKIADAITEMDYLLCFISEDSIKSSWVRKEISIALTQEIAGRQVRVVPAMIGSVQDEQIPPAISDKYYLDFRSNAPFEKAMHELLMLLDEGYATSMSRAVEMLDEPDESRSALEGVLMAAGYDVKGLGELSRYYELYKSMGIEIDKVFEMYEHRPDGAVERLARDLRRDIPYPLWDRLADVDTLRQLLRGHGKDV